MLTTVRFLLPLLLTATTLACAGPAPARDEQSQAQEERPGVPKRIVAAIGYDAPILIGKINRVPPGSEAIEIMVGAGFGRADAQSVLRPELVEQMPTVENGLWKLFPDGRMELTWKIRANAEWQDGTPFTAGDLAFTLAVGREVPNIRHPGYESIEGLEMPDSRTVVVKWKEPYIDADTVFSTLMNSSVYTLPLPRHLLEQRFADRTSVLANILDLPYWADDYVGTGPYRLREFVRGGHALVVANDRYVLGRPTVDEIEVRFIGDPNALVANILAGVVEVTLGRNISVAQALPLRDQWAGGKVDIGLTGWHVIFPQFVDANPPIVTNLQFRRALLHAIDRQEMADSLQAGLVPVAHSLLSPREPDYREIEPSVVKYDYGPRRTAQLIEDLGYTRGLDGTFRDAAGQPLSIELRGGSDDQNIQVVADYWRRVGVAVNPYAVPEQLFLDKEFVSSFPAFYLLRQPNTRQEVKNLFSWQVPLPENRFFGSNRARYANPNLDALLDGYFGTIPMTERTRYLAQIMGYTTENVVTLGLIYGTEPTMIGNRLVNIAGRQTTASTQTWNVTQWDVR